MKKLRFGMIGAAAVAVALFGGLLIAGTAAAQGGATLSVSDGSAMTGEEGSVTVGTSSISDPGLAAWTVDLSYDTSVITAVDCSAEHGGVCNTEFGPNMVRITGGSASGIEGDTDIGSVTFECGSDAGSSALTLSIHTLADGTIGGPQDIDATVVDGSFTCGVIQPPTVGTGLGPDGGSSFGWLIALLAIVGTAGLVVGFGAQRSR